MPNLFRHPRRTNDSIAGLASEMMKQIQHDAIVKAKLTNAVTRLEPGSCREW
jgi:hypothetical protein